MVGFPAIGERIGAYRVDAEIGRGGMGIVYRATQLALNRPVALKILDPRLAADPTFVERFTREATILASLDSPHIIQIFDHGNPDGYLYLAMQYVAGGDVSQLVSRNGPLAPQAAIQIFMQVIEALGDAHSRGIVHRDVKPSNVLLRADGTEPFAYLCDFGIAHAPESGLTQPGLVAGSWAFMSPERHSGAAATPRSDLYSAACVLWAMLTGRNVYSGTDVQIAMAHLHSPVPQLPGSDPLIVALNRLFWTCLAKDSDERPDSAAEVLALARGPLSLAEGVTPLSISKPDSGIFRPAPLVRPAADEDGTQLLRAASIAPHARPAGQAGAPAAGAASVPASGTVPAARRASPVRWLVGGGALIVSLGLVLAVMNLSGAFGRQPAAASSPTAAVTATTAPTATPTADIRCWNSAQVSDLSECTNPTGKSGLRYLYLSLDQNWDSCSYKAYRPTTVTYDCVIGERGVIRYRFWEDSDEAARHYAKRYAKAKVSTMYLDGEDVGFLYRLDKKVSGRYALSGFWLDGHASFSVESATIGGREALLPLVRIRAYDQLTGHPSGADTREGVFG